MAANGGATNRVGWSLFLGLTMLAAACGGEGPDAAAPADTAISSSSIATEASSTTTPVTTTESVSQETPTVATAAPTTTDPPVTTKTEASLEVAFEPGASRDGVDRAVQLFFEASAIGEWDIAASVYGTDPDPEAARTACGVGCRADVTVLEVYSHGPRSPLGIIPRDLEVEVQTSAGTGFVAVQRLGQGHWSIKGELPAIALGEGSPSQLVEAAQIVSPTGLVVAWPGAIQHIDADGQLWKVVEDRSYFGFLIDDWFRTGPDFLSTTDLSVICTTAQDGLRAAELVRFNGRLTGRYTEADATFGDSVDIDCETGELIDGLTLPILDPFESVTQVRNGVTVRDQHYFEHDRTIERADGSPITEDLISGGWRLSPDGRTVAYVGACSRDLCSLVIRHVGDGSELGRWEFPYHVGIGGFDGRWALVLVRDSISLVDTAAGTVHTFSTIADVRLIPTE